MNEEISYKKQPNDFRVYLAMDTMSRLYELSEEKQLELSKILAEGDCDDYDFEGILEQDARIRNVFGVPYGGIESRVFSDNYSTSLKMAVEQARLWSN
jgi:hypothetical protein